MFLGWYDFDTKKPTSEKIAAAIERYIAKFGKQPNLVLVNLVDAIDYDGVEVRPVGYVQKHHFWVGTSDV